MREVLIAVWVFSALLFSSLASHASEALERAINMAEPTAALVMINGETVVSENKDKVFPIGSTFKLAVLVALNREIEKGQAAWDEVIFLEEKHRSLPSGISNYMPAGTPSTLHTLATLMISLSDNTATDVLIDRLGREKIEAIAGGTVLTTREFFVLKAHPKLRQLFEKEGLSRALESRLSKAKLPEVGVVSKPFSKAVEWNFSVQHLCTLIAEVKHLSVFVLNPGLARRKDWKRIAYKGGSEVGVLNLTTSLMSHSGEEICVSVTWNSSGPLDDNGLFMSYKKILKQLKSEKN